MKHQTHIERLAGRESVARARGRTEPVIGHDDRNAGAVAAEPAIEGARGPWAVGSIVAGRFVLQRRLGRDRYGPIYKALDRSLSDARIGVEHHVALQELHPRIAMQRNLLERLEQQLLNPQSWSHPNLVKLIELGRDGEKYFLSSELLEGASLRLVLDESAPEALAYHDVLAVLRAAGDALNYAHAKGIVHGDLRPENAFVTNDYAVKLLGLLPITEPRASAFFVEDRDSDGQPHPSDDVYGLACLAYELLTRRHPYNGNSPLEALHAGLAPYPVPDLAPLRWEALSRGLALRRERRTASVAELLTGLGVTGTEILRPDEDAQPKPAPAAAWPEVTVPLMDARHRGGAGVTAVAAAPAALADARPARARDSSVMALSFDAEAPALAFARPRSRRRSNSARMARMGLGGVLLAALGAVALLVYRDYSQLRLQAGDVIENASVFASEELARWQARSAAPKRAEVSPAAVSGENEATELAAAVPPESPPAPKESPPKASTAAVPTLSTAADSGAQASASEPVVRSTREAAVTPPAAPPAAAPIAAAAVAAAPAASTPRFEFAERTVTVSEREPSARVVIRRTGSLAEEASVVWWTVDRTALADEDYAVLGARIEHFAAGEETRAIYVPLVADSVAEQRESFFVNLGADRAGSRAGVRLEVVVLDDDS
jgi:hypothetical protein